MNAPAAIEALVVDYGGVLTTPIHEAMARFALDLGLDLQDFARVALMAYAGGEDDLVVGFETGAISEADFSEAFARRLSDACGREVDPAGLVARVWGGVKAEPRMLDLVAETKAAGLKTGLLSNSWGVEGYPRDRLAELFDAIVISAEVGLRKPDPRIYAVVLERLGVDASRAVFVDDHPGHLAPAKEIGFTTVLHRSPDETIAEVRALLAL